MRGTTETTIRIIRKARAQHKANTDKWRKENKIRKYQETQRQIETGKQTNKRERQTQKHTERGTVKQTHAHRQRQTHTYRHTHTENQQRHNSTFVSHIVNFIENNPGHFTHNFRTTVEHASQNFCGHDKTTGRRVDGHISSHQADIFELFLKFAVLLIAQCFDGAGVDHALFVSQRHGNRILCNHRLAS